MTLHQALVAYVLAAMNAWIPAQSNPHGDYKVVAEAVVGATEDPEEALELASVSSYESGFCTRARNPRSGAKGAFQLLGGRIPQTVSGQAKEALRRWREQGRCGYTGEARTAPVCPLADERYYRAFMWSYRHPFVAPAVTVAEE